MCGDDGGDAVRENVGVVKCEVVHAADENLFEIVCVGVGYEDDGCEKEAARQRGTYGMAVETGVVCECDVLCDLLTKFVLGHQAAAVLMYSPLAMGCPAGVGSSV